MGERRRDDRAEEEIRETPESPGRAEPEPEVKRPATGTGREQGPERPPDGGEQPEGPGESGEAETPEGPGVPQSE